MAGQPGRKEGSDEAVVMMRVDEVRRRIVLGYTSRKIIQYAFDVWDLEESQARKYIAKAKSLIKQAMSQSATQHMAEHIEARKALRVKTLERALSEDGNSYDAMVANSVLQEEAKLLNLYKPDKIALTNPDGDEEYGSESESRRSKQIDEILSAWRSREASASTPGEPVDTSDGAASSSVLQSGG